MNLVVEKLDRLTRNPFAVYVVKRLKEKYGT